MRLKCLVEEHKCYFCGIEDHRDKRGWRRLVEIHHIKEKNVEKDNTPGNLVPLCSNHHSLVHMGEIKLGRWYFSTSGKWLLQWWDVFGNEYLGV
jgi:predicted restriction endonuclease